MSQKKAVFRRFLRRKVSVVAACVLIAIIAVCLIGPLFMSTDPNAQDLLNAYAAPSAEHFFGTDKFGRDIFTRVCYGARISLTIGFSAALINLVIGTVYGGISGYVGGRVDLIMMRLVEDVYKRQAQRNPPHHVPQRLVDPHPAGPGGPDPH